MLERAAPTGTRAGAGWIVAFLVTVLGSVAAVVSQPGAAPGQERSGVSAGQESEGVEARVVARIPDPALFPEGVAVDPASGDLFVSSIRKRTILRHVPGGRTTTFLATRPGVWAVFGLRLDPDRRLLWAATAAWPQMEGFTESLRGRAALLGIDMRGRVRHRLEPVPGETERLLGDVLVGPGGRIWSTDSIGGAVFTAAPGDRVLRPRVPEGTFRSPQGLAIPASRGHLYLADYPTGIWRLPLGTGDPELLGVPDGAEVRGIDGLYAWGDDLVAIQNGTRTRRVLLLRLDADGRRIQRVVTLVSEHPAFQGGEPTLGAVHEGRLLLVANSLWPRLGGEGDAFPDPATLPEPLILEVELPMASIAIQ